jgi:hypothetical protein
MTTATLAPSPMHYVYDGRECVSFVLAPTRDKAAPPAYIAIVADNRFPGMYRLNRTDGSFSDMVNLTRARDALAEIRGCGASSRKGVRP